MTAIVFVALAATLLDNEGTAESIADAGNAFADVVRKATEYDGGEDAA